LGQQLGDSLVVADGASEIAVHNALPIANILLAERCIEAISMADSRNIGGGSALAEHLSNRVSGNQVDHQEDEADHQPDDWEGVEDALEEGFQFLVPGCQLSVATH
jgi:hypothetical protein